MTWHFISRFVTRVPWDDVFCKMSLTEISWWFSICQLHHCRCTHFFDWAFRFWRNAFFRLIFHPTLAGYRINLSRQCSLHACPPCQTFCIAVVFSFLMIRPIIAWQRVLRTFSFNKLCTSRNQFTYDVNIKRHMINVKTSGQGISHWIIWAK